MSTLLKATVAVGLALVLIGTAQAVVLNPGPGGSPRVDLGLLGDPAIPGSASAVLGAIRLVGGGSNIGGTADHGFFLYEELVGDGSISTQLSDFITGSSLLKMGGVMVRDSLDAGAANAANYIVATNTLVFPPEKNAQAQARLAAGNDTLIIAPAALDDPGVGDYVRVSRSGDVFTFAWSPTGLAGSWIDYSSSVTAPMAGTVYVGVAITSRDNSETASARFRNTTITGFTTATLLTWDQLGDDTWNSLSWLGGPPNTPDITTNVLLDTTNTDRVTVAADGTALDVTVKGGTIAIGAGRTLKAVGSLDFQANGYLEMANGAKLVTYGGGTITNLVNIVGDSTIDTLGNLAIKNLGANLFVPGTLTKRGAGTLQLDNSAGVIIAPNTTFKVEQGMLASKGADPLGGADAVILEGTTLKLENAGAISMATALTLPASSTLIVDTAPLASMGPLTLGAATTLTTSGSGGGVGFASTGISFVGPGAVTFNTLMNTGTGPINLGADLVTITKTGGAKLIVSGVGTNLANATFDVQQGALVGVAGSNPFGAAALKLGGGELVLANNGADNPAVFDNALTLTADSTLTGGKGGLPVAGPPNVTLGGTKGLTLADRILSVRTTDGYTLNLAGALANTGGEVKVTGGTVNLSGGGGGASPDLRVTGGVASTIANLLTFDDVRIEGGTLNIGAQLVCSDDYRVSGGLMQTSAPVSVGDDIIVSGSGVVNTGASLTVSDALQVTGGAATTNAPVAAGRVLASGGTLNLAAVANANSASLSGSALVSASQLVLTNSLRINELKPNEVVYSINTGTMTASGANLLAGVDLAFGGNTLTVRGPVPTSSSGLQGLWTFNDDTANDSSGNGRNGVKTGGAYSSDVKGVLGGRSVDLTGGDNYVVVDTGGTQNAFNAGNGITVSAWVKGWPDGGWEPFLSKGGESGEGWQVRRVGDSSNDLTFTTRGIGDDDPVMDGDSAPGNDRGNWHLVTATYDGLRRRLYVNGVLRFTDGSDRPGPIAASDSKLVFGGRDASGWGGGIEAISRVRLDDIYIYDRALNLNEVNALFNNIGSLKPALNLPNTNLKVAADATLVADTQMTATFGDLALDPGVALTIQTQATQPISFGDVTAGDGASIAGKVLVRDKVSVGSSPGVLDLIGDLTLAGTSVYGWELTSTSSDLINVSGKLTLKPGWTLKVVTSEPLVYGQHLLFTYGTSVAPSIPNYDLSEAPGWSANLLELDVDTAGNVFLLVPEPATWAMLLAAGVVGLLYARRRRRAA